MKEKLIFDNPPPIERKEFVSVVAGRDTARYRVVEADAKGRHELSIGGIGYSRFVDTVTPRIGYSDTIVVWLRDSQEEYRNTYNCRPRGFRQPGEPSCVTEPEETEAVLMRAREFAGQGSLKSLGIAPFDSSRVTLIKDEKTCRRAARIETVTRLNRRQAALLLHRAAQRNGGGEDPNHPSGSTRTGSTGRALSAGVGA